MTDREQQLTKKATHKGYQAGFDTCLLKLRSEIERLKDSGCASPIVVCDNLLSIIDSLQEEPVDVGTQIYYQNEAIKQLNSALNSMEHCGHLPLVEDNMISDKYVYGKEPEMVDIDDLPLDACNIQYASIDGAIKAHAEDYSFNIGSELFQQLTPEQQKMWRKEIEQACISGGYSSLNLAKDPHYKENVDVKEVNFEKELNNYGYYYDYVSLANKKELVDFAKHFFKLGMRSNITEEDCKLIWNIGDEIPNMPEEKFFNELLRRYKVQKGKSV